MSAIETIFSQYSIESIILLIIGLAFAFKFITEVWDWFYGRIKNYFSDKENHQDKIAQNAIDHKNFEEELTSFIQEAREAHDAIQEELLTLTEIQKRTTERIQETARSHIIDKHHYFVYKIKAIDDMNLQSLEREYMYYKADKGNSFIDQLMEEVRRLPRINIQNRIEEVEKGAMDFDRT